MTRRLWLAMALVVLVSLSAAACGSSTGDDADSGGDAGVASARPFCLVVADVNELYRTTSTIDLDSTLSSDEMRRRQSSFKEQIDAAIARGERLFSELEAAAPAEIANDVRLLGDDATARARAFRDSGGDPIALLTGMWPPSNTLELRAAVDRVDAHTRAECGSPFGPPAEVVSPTLPSDPPAPPAPPAPAQPLEPPAPPG